MSSSEINQVLANSLSPGKFYILAVPSPTSLHFSLSLPSCLVAVAIHRTHPGRYGDETDPALVLAPHPPTRITNDLQTMTRLTCHDQTRTCATLPSSNSHPPPRTTSYVLTHFRVPESLPFASPHRFDQVFANLARLPNSPYTSQPSFKSLQTRARMVPSVLPPVSPSRTPSPPVTSTAIKNFRQNGSSRQTTRRRRRSRT